MGVDYTDGPADQPWEVIEQDWCVYVQRVGCDARERANNWKMPYEFCVSIESDDKSRAVELAARLNRLDAVEAALRVLVGAVEAYTAAVNSPLPDVDYVGVDTAAAVMGVATQAVREVLQ